MKNRYLALIKIFLIAAYTNGVFAQQIFDTIVLDKVEILPQQRIILGAVNEKVSSRCHIVPLELITHVENPSQKQGIITTVLYKLENTENNRIGIIKPHVYSVVDKQLGKEFLSGEITPVFVNRHGRRIILKVDISKYKINLPPEGVFVGLEYLGCSENEKLILSDSPNSSDSPFAIYYDNTSFNTSYHRRGKKIEKREHGRYCFGIEAIER
ncbi:MAG: hypothetical protein LBR10_07470 [Prevotellaceae bacterium]|jgi:hypothetical protein|nr:hypothetical protein [Prevotellaceae bacterium]